MVRLIARPPLLEAIVPSLNMMSAYIVHMRRSDSFFMRRPLDAYSSRIPGLLHGRGHPAPARSPMPLDLTDAETQQSDGVLPSVCKAYTE